MIQEILIAFHSLVAHRRKTWAIVASVTLGICALVLVGGYYEYNFWGLKQSLIRSQYAHVQIYPRDYLKDRDVSPFMHSLDNADALVAKLEGNSSVITAAPRSRAMGMANGIPVEIWGVDPERESKIFTFSTSKRGTGLTDEDVASCQMSPCMAKKIGVELNGTVSLMGVREDFMINAVDLKVQSLIGSYAEDFDQMVIIVPESVFFDLFGTDMTHEVAILYKNDSNLAARRDALQKELHADGLDVEILIWYEQATYFRQVVEYYQGFYRIILAIVAIIVFFATGTTMSLSLLERTREFGTCLSMGTRRITLVLRILGEALIAGIIGLAAGALVSFVIAAVINLQGGIYMPTAPGMSSSINVFIRYSSQAMVLSLFAALVVPLAAVIMPARRIMKQSIVSLLNKAAK